MSDINKVLKKQLKYNTALEHNITMALQKAMKQTKPISTVCIQSPVGTGKMKYVDQFASHSQISLSNYMVNRSTNELDLFGSFQLIDKKTQFKPSALGQAFQGSLGNKAIIMYSGLDPLLDSTKMVQSIFESRSDPEKMIPKHIRDDYPSMKKGVKIVLVGAYDKKTKMPQSHCDFSVKL